MLDPERPLEPPDIPDREYVCPVCGAYAREFYFDRHGDVFGCDICVRHDFVDDVKDLPEDAPIHPCEYCGTEEQSVYLDKDGKIRACFACVEIKPAEQASL